MSDLRFQKLTPTSNVDLNAYEEGFEFIFSNDDIRNIAVSGPYSSGKSSLLESYKKKHPQKTFIHISLAHFTNENKDNEEKEIEDSETVIEGKILNQLIQQIPIENIPQSNFRIKRTTGTNYNGYWAMGIVAFIGMLLFVLNYGKYCTWINEMNSAVWNYEWLRKFMFFLASPFGWVLSVLCIVVIACLGLYNLLNIQTNKNIFKKISVQGNEIEIFEDSQNSYFDKYLNEIIEIIYNVKATRKPEDFEERLINRDGKKLFPLFLVLDEPEVHQHPYRQRSLIRKIKALIENNNQEFLNLLKDLFDIDGLTGQIFIATHSPNILLDNYRQFIRLYKSTGTDSQLKIVSGMNVVIDDKLYKHMLHNFIYLKEAMFSKCIIFVEGDTENGAIPVFAERMGFDMDERGIGVIKLDGADSVKRCMALYKSFGIKSIALIDKDKKESYSSEPDIYFTKANDYEEDVYDNFKLTDYLKCCKELSGVEPYIPILRREGLNFNPGQFVENPANIEIDDTLQMKIMVENKDRELQKLKQSKNAAKGAVLAGYVTVIPPAFEKIINKLIKEVK